jgi:hypothetical protein
MNSTPLFEAGAYHMTA